MTGRVQLQRETLAEQVARHLLDEIDEWRLQPGDALPSEAKLAQQFGVSRPIIREALRSLEARDAILIESGKGATVKPLSGDLMRDFFRRALRSRQQAIVELMEIRRGLEIEGASLAAERRGEEDLAELERLVEGMRRTLHDADANTRLDVEFHLALAAASRNTLLYHLVASVREPMQDILRTGYQRHLNDGTGLGRIPALHQTILEAVRRGDPDGAARAMAAHFDRAMVTLTHGLARDDRDDRDDG